MPIRTSLRLPPSPKVMWLGDSLTYGISGPPPNSGFSTGGWREFVHREFPTLVPYGGERNGNATYLLSIGKERHEGHGGYTAGSMLNGLSGWLAATEVTINLLILHCGTNGGANPGGQAPTASSVGRMYELFMAHNPGGVMLVGCNPGFPCSTDYPGDGSPYASVYLALQACFAAIKAVVDTLPRALAVDVGSDCNDADLVSDQLHPQLSGYQKAAAGWTAALRALHVGMEP